MSRIRLRAIFCLALAAVSAGAETTGSPTPRIALQDLGGLDLRYVRAAAEDSYPGQAIAASVTFRKGEAFTLVAPRRVQQIEYLVEVGDSVRKGQPLAIMRGPEMHHFLFEFEAGKDLLDAARGRYESNKPLYERKAISQGQWLEVSQNYYAAQLEYEHSRHFYELVIATDEERDTITIAAPAAGIVAYSPSYSGLAAADDIAVFVPEDAVRLEAAVPAATREGLAYLQAPECRLAISSTGGIANRLMVSGWTEPLKPECQLILGQRLLVTPYYHTAAVRVPAAALFQWREGDYVLVRSADVLEPVPVELVAAAGPDYLVQGQVALAGRDVLVSSVSAVQGILLGLGGE
jgi:hypothetical protein